MPRQTMVLWEGLDKILRNLNTINNTINTIAPIPLKRGLKALKWRINDNLESYRKGLSPPRENPIAESWEISEVPEETGGSLTTWGLVNKSPHAIFVEFGTAGKGEFASEYTSIYRDGKIWPRHDIQSEKGNYHSALRFTYDNQEWIVQNVEGQVPKPFIRETINSETIADYLSFVIGFDLFKEIERIPMRF